MSTQVRPIIPALGSLWSSLDGFSSVLLRIGVGAFLIPHGVTRMINGLDGTAKFMAASGIQPAYALTCYITGLEIIGGVFLVLGFLTRPVAALVLGFMLVGVYVHLTTFGYFWTAKGAEVPLIWSVFTLILLIKGAGPCSVDQKLGREF